MSLTERVNKSTVLSQQEKLILGILSDGSMTTKELVECLMSEPYDLTHDEIFKALTGLKRKGLLELGSFTTNVNGFDIDIKLTFAYNWVFKL